MKLRLALDPNTSPKILEKLAEERDEEIRLAVALNTSTPIEVLAKLSNDQNEFVRKLALSRALFR
jgi:pentose-5-phosphate-3-epimerase